jgi:hypothetical protein
MEAVPFGDLVEVWKMKIAKEIEEEKWRWIVDREGRAGRGFGTKVGGVVGFREP